MSEYNKDQWWYQELLAAAKKPDATDDFKRAVYGVIPRMLEQEPVALEFRYTESNKHCANYGKPYAWERCNEAKFAEIEAYIAEGRSYEVRKLYSAPQASQPVGLTDSYVQQVPDKCDRIVWRNRYYQLPIEQAGQPVRLTDDAIEDFRQWLNARRNYDVSFVFHDTVARVSELLAASQPDAEAIRREALEEIRGILERIGNEEPHPAAGYRSHNMADRDVAKEYELDKAHMATLAGEAIEVIDRALLPSGQAGQSAETIRNAALKEAEERECRHCGWLCRPNDAQSKRFYPLEQPAPVTVPERWMGTVEKAAENAAYVFKDSCNHTKQAIDYMKQVMLSAAPAPAETAAPSEDAKDAARYRWLREKSVGQWEHPIVVEQQRMTDRIAYIGPLSWEALDVAIDAAIATQANGGKHE